MFLDLLRPPFTVAPGHLFIVSSKSQGILGSLGSVVLQHYIDFLVLTLKSEMAGLNNFSKPTNVLQSYWLKKNQDYGALFLTSFRLMCLDPTQPSNHGKPSV